VLPLVVLPLVVVVLLPAPPPPPAPLLLLPAALVLVVPAVVASALQPWTRSSRGIAAEARLRALNVIFFMRASLLQMA
jgi:hypothetical protein